MQMGVHGVHDGELWVWSKLAKQCKLDAIPVRFNEPFWKQLKAKLDVFYTEYVSPLILTYTHATAEDADE
jgi:hypothetical protein